ncbi:NfeD family protein [uncultured Cohaesibacter sp.]|uniref:NfeD family protein n=1 Tax=uncultured Cohaesibacter sp. TaxID=1002546 RepID=UPI00292FB269|nr:NfeD family protein [uncultured Cohaesibacter sp.]
MIQQLIVSLGTWSWVILGLALLVLEIVAPGIMLLWFGIAALLVGGIAFLVDLGWQSSLILFAILSLCSVLVGRFILAKTANSATDKPMLNKRALALVGNVYQLEEPIVNGHGRVKVRDSYWRVIGPDCPAGSRIEVVGGDGASLEVSPVEK